jgi:hypothetical protein
MNLIAMDRFLNLPTGGIHAGFLVEASVIEWSLRSFDASVYTQVQQIKHAWLHVLAKATLGSPCGDAARERAINADQSMPTK